jgi:uncharacterized protein YndB with AHSA1/START domain
MTEMTEQSRTETGPGAMLGTERDTTSSETSLRIERVFDAPSEQVFDAWTNPEVLRRWWAVHPDGSTPVADVDLRVGGRYRLTMRHPDGSEHTVGGEYREIVRPSKLVYSWQWEQGGGEEGHVSTVNVSFHDRDGRTLVVLEHTGLPDAQSRDRHAEGWSACLEIFNARGFGEAGRS